MPTFIGMFESSGQDLPGPTQVLLGISNWLTEYWYIFITLVIGAIVGTSIFKKTLTGKTFFDNLKIKIPILKDTNTKIITSRFTRTLSTLLSSGMPLLQSMEIVGKVVGNKVVEDRLKIASEDIRKGVSLSQTIKNVKVFPPMVDSMIRIEGRIRSNR